jgi:GH24 family phage-related lysozyme (muramidase)
MKVPRKAIAGLTLSAAALFALVMEEGYTDKAVIPTKGDRPTLGFGSTFHEDGRPVKMGDTTTPTRALIKMKAHIDKEEASFIRSLPGVELHQGEHDLYMGFVYQYGTSNWWKSSMRTRLLAQPKDGL